MPKLILTFLLVALLTTSAAAVELVGYCFLEDQPTFAGTMVVFTGFEIWFVTDTAYTDVNGFFRIVLPPDAYDIHYTHPGYLDWWETASAFTGTVVLPTVNLQPLPGTPLGGALSGTLPYESSYVVWDSIWIEATDTLVIAPGVEINFADSATFAVFGMLQAVGSLYDSVHFLPLPTQFPTTWGGLRFYATASDCCRMDYCLVQGAMNGFGGGIHIENAAIWISNSTIQDNSGGEGASQGGGIYVTEASPRIVNCLITQNSAAHGGGLYGYNASPLLTNCVFDNNAAEQQGGGIYLVNADPEVSNCSFLNNVGGGIFCASSNPEILDCDFYSNSGTAIGLDNSSPAIDECFFYANSGDLGGAINCSFNSNSTVNDCHLLGNSSTLGGGVYIAESHPSLHDCTIENNVSTQFGGGVYVDQFSDLSIEDCSFEENSADLGGGIATFALQVSILNSTFNDNEAARGGAIGGQGSSLSLSNCQFSDNSATERGGGIFLDYSSNLTASGCSFHQNVSQTNGGGIYSKSQGVLNITDSDFQGDSAVFSGGSIYCEFSALSLTGCEFVENAAGVSGGAVFDSSFISTGRQVTQCLFQGNSAGNRGGGLALIGGSTTVGNCTITGNSCGINGGGVYLLFPVHACFYSSIIENNLEYGIYLSNPAYSDSVLIRYCDFCSNDSGDYIFFPYVVAPVGLGEVDTVNLNGDSCDVYANIFLDPLFTDPGNGEFTLQASSPCLDAGDPQSPLDPDSTIADIGAFPFYQALAVENQPLKVPPAAFCLYPVYPNPFNAEAILRFDLPQAGYVRLSVFDITGREVGRIEEGFFNPSSYRYTFDGSALASGLYFVRLQAQDFVAVQKVTLVK